MFQSIEQQGLLARERIEREIATAELLRRTRRPAASIRQSVGLRMIRIGARLASEPTIESAWSR